MWTGKGICILACSILHARMHIPFPEVDDSLEALGVPDDFAVKDSVGALPRLT